MYIAGVNEINPINVKNDTNKKNVYKIQFDFFFATKKLKKLLKSFKFKKCETKWGKSFFCHYKPLNCKSTNFQIITTSSSNRKKKLQLHSCRHHKRGYIVQRSYYYIFFFVELPRTWQSSSLNVYFKKYHLLSSHILYASIFHSWGAMTKEYEMKLTGIYSNIFH